jgi:hypothetical protein
VDFTWYPALGFNTATPGMSAFLSPGVMDEAWVVSLTSGPEPSFPK